jgi:hypothetical protein
MRGKSQPRAKLRNIPIPAAATDEGKARLNDYWLALGEFIDNFAGAERTMHRVLRWHTKTLDKVARSVFSGVRIDTARGYLRRLADAGMIEAAEWTEMAPVLAQLQVINDVRNLILHYGSHGVAEGKGFATNAEIAHTDATIKATRISPGIIRAMSADVHKIRIHLMVCHMGRTLRGSHPQIETTLHSTWRYIPPPLPKKVAEGKSPKPQASLRRSARLQPKPSPE